MISFLQAYIVVCYLLQIQVAVNNGGVRYPPSVFNKWIEPNKWYIQSKW